MDRPIITRHYKIEESQKIAEVPKVNHSLIDIKKKAGRPKKKDNDSDYGIK